MVTEDSMQLRKLHRHYKNGLLPYNGGLLDQPGYYLEAMEILDTL